MMARAGLVRMYSPVYVMAVMQVMRDDYVMQVEFNCQHL